MAALFIYIITYLSEQRSDAGHNYIQSFQL